MIDFTTMAQACSAPFILAQATGGTPQGPGGLLGNPLLFFPLMIVMMYFLLIRPQRQKQKEAEATQKAVQAGDEVVTIGGVHGVVTSVQEKTVVVRVEEGKIRYDRSAIAHRKPKNADVEVVK
jgi:preprotein translocase subunit YajC